MPHEKREGIESGPAAELAGASEQRRIVAALRRPAAFPWPATEVIVHETHGSFVFVAGDYAAKLKKCVKTAFFDYSTRALRRELCEREVEINRALAPSIYLGTRDVVEVGDEVRIRGDGDEPSRVLDTVVLMRRIDPAKLLVSRVKDGRASEEDIDALVEILVPFYARARSGASTQLYGTPDAVRRPIEGNFTETQHRIGRDLTEERFAALRSAQLSFLTLHRDLFERRVAEGRIREGHGDLRAEHVAYLPEPVVIDRIEFSEAFRSGDIAADLAFLRMDLEFHGAPRLAERLIERFVARSGDAELPRLVEFYASYRAYVRAKVDAILVDQGGRANGDSESLEARVRRYFELASYLALSFNEPLLVLVGGLSGSGKSTVARAVAEALGAVLIRSDVARKNLAGLAPEASAESVWGGGIYTAEFTDRTYEAILSDTKRYLDSGATVVVDATFSREELRRRFAGAAHEAGARPVLLECRVPRDVALARLAERSRVGGDASDAGPEIRERQEESYEAPRDAVPLDTTRDPPAVIESALAALRSRVRPERELR